MSRQDEFKSNTNPALHYVTWKSNDKQFAAYDKENKVINKKKLPFEFTILKVGSSVKGWSDSMEGAIYSNIITNSAKQELSVRCGSVVIASGKYQEIKDAVVSAGAHFESNIFALHNGEIVMISLKGSALGKWFDFTKQNRNRFLSNKVVVKTTLEGKKGAVKFNTPVFELSDALTVDEANEANEAYNAVAEYLSLPTEMEVNEIEVADEEVHPHTNANTAPVLPGDDDPDDLPF